MRRADAVRYVDVVLDDEPVTDPEPDTAPGPARARSRRRRRRNAAAWAAVAAVLATVAGGSAVDAAAERRDAEALQRYADVPGVLTSLRDPLQERWRLPPADGAWVVGDLVVSAESRTGVVARDAVSGRTRWSVAVPGAIPPDAVRCPHAAGGEAGGGATGNGEAGNEAGAGEAASTPAAVLCLASSVTGGSPDRWAFGLVDASSGDLVQQATRPGGLLDTAMVEGDLVAAAVVDGGLTVSRYDVVTGGELWSTPVPDISARDPRLAIRVTPEVVAVQGVMGVALDARDGREIGGWRPVGRPVQGMSARVLPRAGQGFGVWTSAFLGRWHGTAGEPLAELDGFPADPPVVDRSTPGVVLLGSDDGRRLLAVDVRTGDPQWQRPMPDRVLLRLGGRLVVADDGTLEAVDMGTGRRLWRVALAEGDEPGLGPPLTDGLRVLIRGRDDSGRLRLTAYTLESGDRVWQASVPSEGQALAVLGDRLVSADRRTEQGPAGVLRFLG